MMKSVMKPRAAALALAAPLLFAAPALADHGPSGKHIAGGVSVQTGNGTLQFGTGIALVYWSLQELPAGTLPPV